MFPSTLTLLALTAILAASTVTASPLQRRAPLGSCVPQFTAGRSTIMQCSCTATCTQADFCCDDYSTFHTSVQSFAHANRLSISQLPSATRVPRFHKVELAVTGANNYGTGRAAVKLLTIRSCTFEDVLKVTRPPVGSSGPTVEPKWVLKECSKAFDVVAHRGAGVLSTFEQVVRVPGASAPGNPNAATVRVAVGPLPPSGERTIQPVPLPWNIMYYAELRGASAMAALKYALTLEETLPAFRATLPRAPRGKLAWDPTPRRSWAVAAAELSTVEINERVITTRDVSAMQLDHNFAEYAHSAGYQVSPTMAGHLRRVWNGTKWVDIVDKQGNRVPASEEF